jgi:FkbM family methyltransferase
VADNEKAHRALMKEAGAYRASDPVLFLKALALAHDVTEGKFRFLRSEVLQTVLAKLHRALQLCDFRNEIVVRPEGVFVDVSGVLMEVTNTPFYLKSSGAAYTNQGEAILRVLARMNIALSTAVDVGANFGEISLWLARQHPQARVIAIEPSSDNLNVLRINKAAQRFPTDAVEIVQEAVSERSGVVSITKGVSTMNRVVTDGKADASETVRCDRLDGIFDRYGVRTADFVKIDIEGGEPALKEAIAALGNRVRSYYIEFSKFAPLDDYLALAQTLLSRRFACYDEAGSTALDDLQAIERHLRSALAAESTLFTNLWFVAAKTDIH